MDLIVVESPTKARTFSRFLGPDYRIEATMGHVRDLPQNRFGVDLEHDFQPEYVVIAGKRKHIQAIKQLSNEAMKIYLATDPDREGEAIAWHIAQLLAANSKLKTPALPASRGEPSGRQNSKLARIIFHEITNSAVRAALSHPRSIDMDLVNAQQARRILDRLVGYKLSPLLWRKVRRGLSAGRVQSVAVRLIVEREREIEAFRPEEYWEIYCNVKCQTSNVKSCEFLVKLIQINGQKAEIKNKEQADRVVEDLEKADYRVASIEKKEVSKAPPPPFTTSTMTQAASRLYFWSAKKTMHLAQKLYEGGLITYHRTDSTNLAAEAVKKVRDYILKEYGKEYLPEKPRFYKTTSKVAQEAHEAIRPTDVKLKIKNEKLKIGDEERLYNLIWKRFVACQMVNALYDETTIDVGAKSKIKNQKSKVYLLQARGQVMKFDGWRKVYGGIEKQEISLPDVEKDEQLQLIKILPEQKFTEPPPRYTEATLIRTLEKLGIGRPSTYAPIISTIEERAYVEKIDPSTLRQAQGSGQGGRFRPTPVGVATNDFLVTNFGDTVDYRFTARMENDLDEIANGKVKWVPVIKEFWEPFEAKLEEVTEKVGRVKIKVEETGEVCPKCKEGKQVIRMGKYGRFLSCSRFPECDWKAQYIEEIGMKCPDCGEGEVIIRQTKKRRRFYGCSRYPACNFASWKRPKNAGPLRREASEARPK